MIAFVRGPVNAVENDSVIVNVGGVGIMVAVPLTRLTPRPVMGEEILLHTHLRISEDAWTIYGFTDKEQLRVFRLLLGVSGVGAKTALAIIDKVGETRFAEAIAAQDAKVLTAVSGVGKKLAERILLELKDKFQHIPVASGADDAPLAVTELDGSLLAALRQLGYTASEARSFAMQAQTQAAPDASAELLLREALKIAAKA